MDRKRGRTPKGHNKMEMTKNEIIKAMRDAYMPNFFDIEMFDYTTLSDDQIYDIYLDECENYTKEEIDDYLKNNLR